MDFHWYNRNSLLGIGGLLDLGDLTQHNNTVAFHDGDTAETGAILEALNNEGLNGLKLALSHVTVLNEGGVLDLLLAGRLAHLEVDLGHLNSGTTSANESNGGVANLELSGVVKNDNLGGEVLGTLDGLVLLENHDITDVGHVLLSKTLNVKADIVTSVSSGARLVVHFHSKDLSGAGGGGSVGGDEVNFITGLDDTLLKTASDNITNTLDLVDTGNGHTHGLVSDTGRGLHHVVEGVKKGVDVDSGTGGGLDVNTSPPVHVGGLLEEVITVPSGDGEEGNLGLNLGLLPANANQHTLDLLLDFLITSLSVVHRLVIHLVDANNELFDTKKVDETGVLTGLALDFTSLVVALGDGGLETTDVGGNHEKGDISLGGTSDHVLDKISVSRSIDDGVVEFVSEEFLGSASNGNTTLTLLLLVVHEEGEAERTLAESISFSAKLLHLTLGDPSQLVDETTSGGRLSGINVPADND